MTSSGSSSASTPKVSWGAQSHVGRVRHVNQDSVHAEPGLFVVADGMGGHSGGEVASAVAVDAMRAGGAGADSVETLVERVHGANAAVLDRASHDDTLSGMGTTLCAMAVIDPDWRGTTRLAMVNVGDSRIYRFADGELRQLTHDHSLVAELVRDGHLTPDEAAMHPQRNIVTRALGIGQDVQVDSWEVEARRSERYLLCSDGLFNEVSDSQIAATLRRLDDPAEVVDELVRLANDAGARDNVSVVVVRIDAGEVGPAGELPQAPREHTAPAAAPAAVVGAVDAPGRDGGGWEPDAAGRRVRRRSRIRAVVSTVIVAAILTGGFTLVGIYARDNYYVGFDAEQVVIYQGRPGGVLWFDPTIEAPTRFLRADLTPALQLELDAMPEFGSLRAAESYVADLEGRIGDPQTPVEE